MTLLIGDEYPEIWDEGQPVPIKMIDGTDDTIQPGDTVIWENRECHCCRDAVRIERRLLH